MTEKNIKIDNIHRITCDVMEIPYSETFKVTRNARLLLPRQITMYIVCNHAKEFKINVTLAEIGMYFEIIGFKGYDHATVLHAKKTIQTLIYTNYTTPYGINVRRAINEIIDNYRFKYSLLPVMWPFSKYMPVQAVGIALLGL